MVDAQHAGRDSSSFHAVNHPSMAPSAKREDTMDLDPVQSVAGAATGAGASHVSSTSAQNKSSSTSKSTSAAPPPSNSKSTTNADEDSKPVLDHAAQSLPMTSTTSTSSNASAKDPKEANPATIAAPYGTRSRGSRGVPRPNYAEDAEPMDFELTQPAQNGTSQENGAKSSRTSESRDSPGPSSKKGAAATNGGWASINQAPKEDPIPGTSTFSANPGTASASAPAPAPAPAPTKRRKGHAAQAASNGTHASSSNSSQITSRRGANNSALVNQSRETNMLSFEKSKAQLKNGKLEADDGTVLSVNDYVYLICEPPGEPYYLCRIMEFLRAENDKPNSPIESMRVNWFYRPRDVQRLNNDTRLVYGTMHSDICPITSLRGKCQILHRSEIADIDDYRKLKDSFWFNQVFDRFIHRWYEVVPTQQVINVPEKVKKALDERWKYVVVETSRVKELTSAVKTCKRCSTYCATNDSVECAVCHFTYHMNCVRPPLLKKPSRGFAWACAPCSRAQERKLEARRTPIIGDGNKDGEEDELPEEEEDEAMANAYTTAPSPSGSDSPADLHPASQAEIALVQMWPMRYLGIHARVEDALQYDDRAIYPRASSRLGPRHQANVNVWHGQPVEFVKPAEIKKRYVKAGGAHKKDTKLSKETVAALEADRQEKAKRPKWVQDEPLGYVRRGEDLPNKDPKNSAKLMFRMPPAGEHSERGLDDSPSVTEQQVDQYMARAKDLASVIGVERHNTNFLDKALELYSNNRYDAEAALKQLKKVDRRKDLKEPELTKEEIKKFGEGVAKYGSELRSVRLHVKTINYADTVRFYYLWKKKGGKDIWKNYGGRKGRSKKSDNDSGGAKLLDDVADDHDDSAFDCEKAEKRKRGFQCKFCGIKHSRQWRRAPGVSPGQTVLADGRSKEKGTSLLVALCQRCAHLWRRYAIKWENIDELAKKVAMGGLKASKRRIDEELISEFMAANDAGSYANAELPPVESAPAPPVEPPKKKLKVSVVDKDKDGLSSSSETASKKKHQQQVQLPPPPPPPPRQPTPPPVPNQPKWKILPCAVCWLVDVEGDQLMSCRECRLTVHRSCFGIQSPRVDKWVCDMCKNDRLGKEHVSYNYECTLCPVVRTDQDLVEAPKVSHKKKTDREREKERMEKELAHKMANDYRQHQRERGRPELPREPLKRTADNNWVHAYCALWNPETKFSDAPTLELVEGIGSQSLRYEDTCKICKTDLGACVPCHQPGCHAMFHVGCAHQHGNTFGFDVTPVKGSRRDTVPVFSIGVDKPETGSLSPAIWCKEHGPPKTVVHYITEAVHETGLTALQVYARHYKQADLSLTGTARKANLVDQSMQPSATAGANRRTSTVQGNAAGTSTRGRGRSSLDDNYDDDEPEEPEVEPRCVKCDIDVAPKWWDFNDISRGKEPVSEPVSEPVRPVDAPVTDPPLTNGADAHTDTLSGDNAVLSDEGYTAAPNMSHYRGWSPEPAYTRPTKVVCHSCYLKSLKEPEELEGASLPPVDAPTEPTAPPPAPVSHILPAVGPPIWLPMGSPVRPSWQGPDGRNQPLGAHGIIHPPQPIYNAPPIQHHPHPPHPSQAHQPNGYPPPGSHPTPNIMTRFGPINPPDVRTTMHGSHPPILNNLPNGTMTSIPILSPTHPPPHHGLPHPGSRQSASPFPNGPPPMQTYGVHGSPPPPMHNRPTTPRDAPPAHLVPPPPDRPAASGASASPSLRNLLH